MSRVPLPTFVFQVYARPEIKTLADLKGKVAAVTQPAASTDYAMRIVLKRNGLEPDKDVKMLYAQDMNVCLPASIWDMRRPELCQRRHP
jgi:ABC-type nitrate/sulfonate/bicarbonate transport system substrate-binding protein